MKIVRLYFGSMESAMPLVRELTEQLEECDNENQHFTVGACIAPPNGLAQCIYVDIPVNDCIDDETIMHAYNVDYDAIEIIRN